LGKPTELEKRVVDILKNYPDAKLIKKTRPSRGDEILIVLPSEKYDRWIQIFEKDNSQNWSYWNFEGAT
jgi:hypothetical protein